MPFSERKPERVWPAAEREAGRSGVGPGALDARLPSPRGLPAGRRPENAHAAPAGMAGGAQARGTRGGAGGKLGGPGRTTCIYPPPSLPFRGSNARVAWADGAGRPPDRTRGTPPKYRFPAPPRQTGFLTPSSLPPFLLLRPSRDWGHCCLPHL
ncbi:unnamed protein product [Rangifer tarandus platyrhynchus]|uniref:Uncharacterized protein n=1 Tax=Rangifer tarandus platyrhynchus TaxID=3082113 RepID=A0AC59YK19_RANTA